MYKYLFSPIKINHLEVKNRIAYPALGLLYSYDTRLNDRYYHFFRERAEGGAGIVTVGPVGVDFLGSGLFALTLANDAAIEPFQKLTRIIKDGGARAWIQLFHAGAYSHPFMLDGQEPIAPSAEYTRYSKTTPREMTLEDIRTVQDAFTQTAVRAKAAGFDGVEIIGSAGYLLTQFLSPLRNKRTDDYGGSFENRCRFPKEVVAQTRKQLGSEFPLTVRMAGNDFVHGSNTDTETPEIAKMYENAGADAINVTGGWHESRVPQLPMALPRAGYAYLALNIKQAVSIPVMASNRIADPAEAEKIIRDGYADMVNLGRVLLADPKWPQKALAGRAHEIRPCVACSQGCTDELFSGRPVYCVGNPRTGFEGERQIKKATHSKKVMVIGAGPGGLEAAVTAARAGHSVSLYEKKPDIGGQLWIAGAPPHKKELLEFIRYYRAMVDKYEIFLNLNTVVDAALIKTVNPDHVVVAEGATAIIPSIEGAQDSGVLSSWDVLNENPVLGKNVAVIGGGAVGLETALFVAAKGTITPEILHFLFTYAAEDIARLRELMFKGSSRVTVFEMLHKVGTDVGKSTKWILLGSLKKHGVSIKTGTPVTSIKAGRVRFTKDGTTAEKKFDTVILSTGTRPVRKMTEAVAELGISHSTVGDCVQPGKISNAIHGGFLAALEI